MVAEFLSGVGQILTSLFSLMDEVFILYVSEAIVSSFFALWVIKKALIFFDIIKN